jgi:hypothetical protein
VPAHPLTARGLATPYLLTATNPKAGPCREANPDQSAFVQATIVDPHTGRLSVYNPLVIDKGTTPAVAPVVPNLPTGAVVGIWFGFNGNNLLQQTTEPSCVNGLAGSIFSQVSFCNAPAFFAATNRAKAEGKLVIPRLGTAKDGRPCPTVRDFSVVDQDQSDNVTASYLVTAAGLTAQNTDAAINRLRGQRITFVTIGNGSDNRLVDKFIDGALGCQPFTAPNLADNDQPTTSQALNELQASAWQQMPVALVPVTDPMVQVNGMTSVSKTNLYRSGVDQPALGASLASANARTYCAHLEAIAPVRLRLDRPFTRDAPSPERGTGLYDFLQARLQASLTLLGCKVDRAASLSDQ